MVLPVSIPLLRNTIGYIDLEIAALNNYLTTLEILDINPDDISFAENMVKEYTQNIMKLLKTIEEKSFLKMPKKGYTDHELKNKKIM